MIYLIKKIFLTIGKNFIKNFFFFQILIIFSSIFEILAILSVGPFVAVLFNNNLIFANKKIHYIYSFLHFDNPESFLFFLGFLSFVIIFISSILSLFVNWRLIIFSQNLGYNLSNRLFKFFLKKRWVFFLKNKKSELISKIQIDVMRLTNEVLRSLLIINSKIVLTTFIFTLLVFVSWHLALISILAFSLFYLLFYFVIRKIILENSFNITRYSNERIKILNESFYGIKQIILSNVGNYFYNKFSDTSKILSKSLANNLILSQVPKNILELLSLFLIIFIILFLTKFFNKDFSVIFPIIAIYSLSAFKLIPSLQQIYSGFVSIKGSYASFDRIEKDLKNSLYLDCKNIKHLTYDENNSKNLFNHSLHFKNISFKYPGNKKDTLKNINFKIFKNEKIAIVGLNGSGKSTLLDLILGLLKPSSGNFYIDGSLLTESKIDFWQKKISYIYQNSILFDGTIVDNITFGADNKKNINKSRINQIVTQVGIRSLLKKLPKDLNYQIGESGSLLSGGQKQKIILARSLYKNSDIIVIDEATSALDSLSEKVIMNHFINKIKNKTLIIVSHKINLLKKVDKIIFIQNGKIEKIGKYNQLKNNKNFKILI